MKKFLWMAIPLILGVSVVVLVWQFSEKKFSNLIKYQLQSLATTKLDLKLEIEKIKIELLPPALIIESTKFTPKEDYIPPFNLSRVEVRLDFLSLLGGKIDLSLVHIRGLDLSITWDKIPQNKQEFEEIPLEEVFNFLNLLPISHLILDRSSLLITSSKEKAQCYIQNFGLLAGYNGDTLSFVNQAQMQFRNEDKISPLIKTVIRGFANKKELTLDQLSANSPETDLSVSFESPDFKNFLSHSNGKFYFKVNGSAQEWSQLFNIFYPTEPIALSGSVKFSGDGNWSKGHHNLFHPTIKFESELKSFQMKDYPIGDFSINGTWDKNKLTTERFLFKHPAGNLKISDFNLETKGDFPIHGHINLEEADLQKLFLNINLKNIPVDLGLKSDLLCDGHLLSSDFGVKCVGSVHGSDLLVKSDQSLKSTRIVRLDEFSGSGWVSVDKEKVAYDSTVEIHQSNGTTQGTISYQNGFSIQYQTDNLILENISELAALDFKGKVKITGKTEGNSSYGTIDMNTSFENFWFEKFGLGNVEAPIHYKDGILSISTEQAHFIDTQYNGHIDVNLKDSRLQGHFNLPELYVENLIQSLTKRITVPVSAFGKGQAQVDFEGPFALGEMTYHIESLINKISIANENFDEAKIDISSKDGNVSIANNSLRKNASIINVNGKANPHGMIVIDFFGKNFRLEESAIVNRIFPNLLGNLNFEMTLSNHILAPDVHLQAKTSQNIFGDIEVPDSHLTLDYSKEGLSVVTQLLGNQIRNEINMPIGISKPSRFYLEILNLDFTEYLGLVTDNPLRSEYKSNFTMKMDLNSNTDSFLDSTGSLKLEEFKIARGTQIVTHNRPLWIRLNKGSVTMDDFLLTGPETSVSLKGKEFTLRNLDFNLAGQLNVRILHLFLPFFEEFGGNAKGDIQVSGNLFEPELYGNIDASNIFFKLKGFPHSFEKISSQLEFSQKQIILNSIRGSLAGGTIAGDGKIEWRGFKDLYINIKAHIKDATLLVPDKVRTTGSGDIVFAGNWFPYILSGHYRVYQGLIEMDFGGDTESKTELKQSIYLPKNIQQAQVEPVRLDLQVTLDQNIEIKNAQVNAFIGGQIQIKGDPRKPILLGNIKTQHGSKLFFRDKPFDILSAFVKFNDPNELNPELFITARSRIDTYDVNLMIQGKSQKPTLLLSSQPPLEEQDIISLLALGITSQKLEGVGSTQQAAQTGYQLGTAIISANPLNKQIKESLGVDVKFSSAFGDTKNMTTPKVTMSKDIIPNKFKVSSTSSVNDLQVYNVRLQYLLNESVSAVGTYEKSETQESALTTGKDSTKNNIFGLDLEYKVEFR